MNSEAVAGIRNPVENGVKIFSDNIYEAADIDKYKVYTPNSPFLRRNLELYISWPRLLGGIHREYSQIILPSYTRMVNVNPEKYSAEIVPFVFQLHKVSFDPGTLLGKLNVRLASRRLEDCKKVIVCSKETRSQLLNHTGLTVEQIGIVRAGVDKDQFYPVSQPPEQLDIPENYVLYVGTFVERKNTKFLVDVLERCPEDISLVMAGDCYDEASKKEFMEYAESKDLRDRIRHVGYVSQIELRRLYSDASAYIHPAVFEGYGMAPVEAAACGTPPVLHRDLPVAGDVQEAGEVFDRFDAEIVAEKLQKVYGKKIDYTPRTWEESAERLLDFLDEE